MKPGHVDQINYRYKKKSLQQNFLNLSSKEWMTEDIVVTSIKTRNNSNLQREGITSCL